MNRAAVLVIGGGISGVSIAYELSRHVPVMLLEMESALAYHTSGRSLATFVESYGPAAVRALTQASRPFFEDPPTRVDSPLFSPLGLLMVAGQGEETDLVGFHASVLDNAPQARLVPAAEMLEINPVLAPGHSELGMFDPATTEIDVHELQQGYIRGLRANGGTIHKSAKVVDARSEAGAWVVTDASGTTYTAKSVVNAAGAWADEVAAVFGVSPVGIRPLRRSAFMVKAPAGVQARGIPLTGSLDHSWHFMPQGEMFACSPAEETLQPPSDAKPDELEIARVIDDLNEATVLKIRGISSPWAGLRTFVADGLPVVGADSADESFFWYAAQGGYGMQLAPAMSQLAAADLLGIAEPEELASLGDTLSELSPTRLR
ncbi:FAD-binding oxidoreductase [Streptomyces sp. NBC_01485]|uniref:NAD(P)/FAD-dependent oxidoreductase n=1 Tax=Streptomyces sp. NBC_01485 TaxID=2903884 RepID=UPI002E30BDD9|nr:FAD-dependent oxidoreductase [Streptomyces sp. NBC_01485]